VTKQMSFLASDPRLSAPGYIDLRSSIRDAIGSALVTDGNVSVIAKYITNVNHTISNDFMKFTFTFTDLSNESDDDVLWNVVLTSAMPV
jgi:hypothetical protein